MNATKDATHTSRQEEEEEESRRAVLGRKWVQTTGIVSSPRHRDGYFAFKRPEKLFAAIRGRTPEEKGPRRSSSEALEKGGDSSIKRRLLPRGQVHDAKRPTPVQNSKPTDSDDRAYQARWRRWIANLRAIDQAESHWNKVKARFPEEAKLPYTTKSEELAKARWGWLADKRLADIATVKTELERLKKKIVDSRPYEQAMPVVKGDRESLAIKIIRLRDFGDHDRAARDCDTLIKDTENNPSLRMWYLLAAYVVAGFPAALLAFTDEVLDSASDFTRATWCGVVGLVLSPLAMGFFGGADLPERAPRLALAAASGAIAAFLCSVALSRLDRPQRKSVAVSPNIAATTPPDPSPQPAA